MLTVKKITDTGVVLIDGTTVPLSNLEGPIEIGSRVIQVYSKGRIPITVLAAPIKTKVKATDPSIAIKYVEPE